MADSLSSNRPYVDSNTQSVAQSVTGSHNKTSRTPEKGRRRTEAQKLRAKRAKTLEKIKKRQARHGERPIPLAKTKFLVEMGQYPVKRPAHPAHDDTSAKRRKITVLKPRRRRRTPWGGSSEAEQPATTSDMPIGSPLADPGRAKGRDPATALGRLADLPTEIRDAIMRYLLLWQEDIVVFAGWTRVYPRSRPRLQVEIMSTCQVLRQQGLRILFGENTFAYDLRDPQPHHDTTKVMAGVFGQCVVPIERYGHLVRHIKVTVKPNRMHTECQNFERAVTKFVPGNGLMYPANLHTVTLDIPALCLSDLGWPGWKARPNHVPICDYLRRGSKVAEALFGFRIQWLNILARDKHGACWNALYDLRYLAKDETMRLEYVARLKANKHEREDGTEEDGTEEDGTEEEDAANDRQSRAPYRPKDVKAMEDYWDREVRRATAKLQNLAWRIEGLAVAPDLAIGKLKLWQPVANIRKGRFNAN